MFELSGELAPPPLLSVQTIVQPTFLVISSNDANTFQQTIKMRTNLIVIRFDANDDIISMVIVFDVKHEVHFFCQQDPFNWIKCQFILIWFQDYI